MESLVFDLRNALNCNLKAARNSSTRRQLTKSRSKKHHRILKLTEKSKRSEHNTSSEVNSIEKRNHRHFNSTTSLKKRLSDRQRVKTHNDKQLKKNNFFAQQQQQTSNSAKYFMNILLKNGTDVNSLQNNKEIESLVRLKSSSNLKSLSSKYSPINTYSSSFTTNKKSRDSSSSKRLNYKIQKTYRCFRNYRLHCIKLRRLQRRQLRLERGSRLLSNNKSSTSRQADLNKSECLSCPSVAESTEESCCELASSSTELNSNSSDLETTSLIDSLSMTHINSESEDKSIVFKKFLLNNKKSNSKSSNRQNMKQKTKHSQAINQQHQHSRKTSKLFAKRKLPVEYAESSHHHHHNHHSIRGDLTLKRKKNSQSMLKKSNKKKVFDKNELRISNSFRESEEEDQSKSTFNQKSIDDSLTNEVSFEEENKNQTDFDQEEYHLLEEQLDTDEHNDESDNENDADLEEEQDEKNDFIEENRETDDGDDQIESNDNQEADDEQSSNENEKYIDEQQDNHIYPWWNKKFTANGSILDQSSKTYRRLTNYEKLNNEEDTDDKEIKNLFQGALNLLSESSKYTFQTKLTHLSDV